MNVEDLNDRIATILEHVVAIKNDTSAIMARKRADFSNPVLRLILRFMHETSRLACPCCTTLTIIGPGGTRLPTARLDHYYGPSSNAITNAWLVCDDCNVKLRKDTYRLAKEPRFKIFQLDLHDWIKGNNVIPVRPRPSFPPRSGADGIAAARNALYLTG